MYYITRSFLVRSKGSEGPCIGELEEIIVILQIRLGMSDDASIFFFRIRIYVSDI